LWVISPTVSQRILLGFGATPQPQWPNGIYQSVSYLRTGIIVVHQLPVIKETLWLQLMGKGQVQQQAIQELLALPEDEAYKQQTIENLAILRLNLDADIQLKTENQEVIMNLTPVYEKWRQETLNEGIKQGIEQGIEQEEKTLIFRQLIWKLGSLPLTLEGRIQQLNPNQLERLGVALLEFRQLQDLEHWLDMLAQ
jgi:hypothetical protein